MSSTEKKAGVSAVRDLLLRALKAVTELGLTARQLNAVVSSSRKVARFVKGVVEVIKKLTFNPFESERVEPDPTWNYDTSTLPSVDVQIARQLTGLRLDMDCAVLVRHDKVDDTNTDGLMAIPFLTDLGQMMGVEDPLGKGYGLLGEAVLEKLAATRRFYNYRKGELGPNYVQLNTDVREELAVLEAQTQSEEGKLRFHVLPVSVGASLAGYSPRNARVKALQTNRLPLGFIQVACLLLGWSERLSVYGQRWIDCSADEYNWCAVGAWSYCLFFDFRDGELGLDAGDASGAYRFDGSAVASPGVSVLGS